MAPYIFFEHILKLITDYLDWESVDALYQSSKRIETIVSHSHELQFRRHPSKQAALAYALSINSFDFWSFIMKKPGDVFWHDIASFFLITPTRSSQWDHEFHNHIKPHLTDPMLNTQLYWFAKWVDGDIGIPFESWDVETLEREEGQFSTYWFFDRHVKCTWSWTDVNEQIWSWNIAFHTMGMERLRSNLEVIQEKGIMYIWKHRGLEYALLHFNPTLAKYLISIGAELGDNEKMWLMNKILFFSGTLWRRKETPKVAVLETFLILADLGARMTTIQNDSLCLPKILTSEHGPAILNILLKRNMVGRSVLFHMVRQILADIDQETRVHVLREIILQHVVTYGDTDLINQAAMETVHSSDLDGLNLMLLSGADLETRDNLSSQTLLLAAAKQKNEDLCSFLLSRGADPTARDKFGRTYVDYCLEWIQALKKDTPLLRSCRGLARGRQSISDER